MTKHWDCKLVFKEEEDGPEIDLLDYVNLSEEEEYKIPKNSSYPNFFCRAVATHRAHKIQLNLYVRTASELL
jgi:hypothetical protein